MTPLVSVVMPSYNHERFIKEAILSVLNQTEKNIELIVVDDGSIDRSNAVIASVEDNRLRHIALDTNVGASKATNLGLRSSRGDFIALCNSDDLWEQNKLERQLQILRQFNEIDAVFTNVRWIDDGGVELKGNRQPSYYNIFKQPSSSRVEMLRRLIEEGNFICHPSGLIRRHVYQKIGNYNNSLRQLPDLDMWIRFAQHFRAIIIPDKLIKFRIHAGNTSGSGGENSFRTWAEHDLICKSFFRTVDAETFYATFGSLSPLKRSLNGKLLSVDNKQFARDRVEYLLSYRGPFTRIFREIALQEAYDYCAEYGENVIPSREIYELSLEVGLVSLNMPRPIAPQQPDSNSSQLNLAKWRKLRWSSLVQNALRKPKSKNK